MAENNYSVVTEVGTFGDLNIDDPSVSSVKKKNEDIDHLIAESIKENATNLAEYNK